MTNRFYGDFDTETFGGPRKTDYRNAFQIDRDRIIHSHALRKLQSKTQVYLSGEHDYYRTRLTHSMEVAQIGRSVGHFLLTLGDPLREDFHLDPDLIEATCLAHDLGHPPFGHAGERTLRRLMGSWGGFEGNAQTLRILTEAMYEENGESRGMQPTRALLDGVLKYKTLFRQYPRPPRNHFLYDDQAPVVRFVLGGAKLPAALRPGGRLNAFRSIECQVMDWADDVGYSMHDIVDGVKTGTLTREALERWGEESRPDARGRRLLDELLLALKRGQVEGIFSARIGLLITSCRLRERDGFMAERTNRHRYALEVKAEARHLVRFYKTLANDVIFDGPRIRGLESRADEVLGALWDSACRPNGRAPLGRRKAKAVCNWIAGHTDSGVVRTFRVLTGKA